MPRECGFDRGNRYAQHREGKRRDDIRICCEHPQFSDSFGIGLADNGVICQSRRQPAKQLPTRIRLKFAGVWLSGNSLAHGKGCQDHMIAEWLQRYETWFESPTNMAWFIGFWLFVGFLIVLEILVPAFQRQPERSYRWPTNFAFGLVNNGLAAIVPLSTISAAVWASRSGVGLLNQVAIPLWVSMGCTLAVYSLTHYVIHVMEHKTPWWWRIHRVHHLDTHLDVSTSQRHHPLELVLDVLILVAVTIVFGLTSWVADHL